MLAQATDPERAETIADGLQDMMKKAAESPHLNLFRELPNDLANYLIEKNVPFEWSDTIAGIIIGFMIAGAAVLIHLLLRKVFLRLLTKLIIASHISWDDALLKSNALSWLVHWVPALVVFLLAELILMGHFPEISILQGIAKIYLVVVGVFALNAFLNGLEEIVEDTEAGSELPLTSLVQVLKLFIYVGAGLIIIATLTGKELLKILAGMGIFASIVMLVFKDSILGLVAGIQLAANRMIRVGDWIEMPKHGADGDVLGVGLTIVKVQNFDKTITTVPTYAFISESFKNWRGMQESTGRRIKRSIFVDVNSVHLCTPEMLKRFERIEYLKGYLDGKEAELEEWNKTHVTDPTVIVNGRRLTNVGTFRAYIEAYLRSHPHIHQDMTLLVRQLSPTEHGLPIEIYCFSSDKRWIEYEAIQADIFDHLLAVAEEFDLRIFQEPSGSDFRQLTRKSGE